MCYGMNYELKKITRKDVKQIVQASREAFTFLENSGIAVMPPKENDYYMPGIKCKFMSALYWIMAKTSLGEIFIAGHCRYAAAEMKYIDQKFDEFRKAHGYKEMPVWDELRKGFLCYFK